MTTRLIKWAVIAALVAALAWGAYAYGKSVAREKAAEKRATAIAKAQREAERRMWDELDRARAREAEHAKRRRALEATLREREREAAEFSASDEGQKECFGGKGKEKWNAL